MAAETSVTAGDGSAISTQSVFNSIRRHGVPGLALAQKLAGGNALEVSAEGASVQLSDGRTVLDFGGYAVTLLGHRHPRVIDAVIAQLETLPTSTRLLVSEPVARLHTKLVETVGSPALQRCWFGLNGSDAVEAALKLARLSSGRLRVLALEGGFHGKSLGALATTHSSRYRGKLEPLLQGVSHIAADTRQLRAELARGDVAALIIEPIQGEGGVVPVQREFLVAAARQVREAGAFLIADEVQTGLGRCGAVSLTRELGVEPDAILFGKPLGGGVLPLSALVCTEEMFDPLLRDPFVHTSTFSGHPLCAAAGVAALEVVEGSLERVDDLARAVEEMLGRLVSAHPTVLAGKHGRGLLWGLDCTSSAAAGWLLTELAPRGLLVSPCLGAPATIRLLPPLIVTLEQLETAASVLDAACEAAASQA